jgi:hypothetical protein
MTGRFRTSAGVQKREAASECIRMSEADRCGGATHAGPVMQTFTECPGDGHPRLANHRQLWAIPFGWQEASQALTNCRCSPILCVGLRMPGVRHPTPTDNTAVSLLHS